MGHLYLHRRGGRSGRRRVTAHRVHGFASFLEHFRNPGFKRGLRGTVRMETPVIYLYDSREETVSVKVAFSKGVITEWYPRASRVEPAANILMALSTSRTPTGALHGIP